MYSQNQSIIDMSKCFLLLSKNSKNYDVSANSAPVDTGIITPLIDFFGQLFDELF